MHVANDETQEEDGMKRRPDLRLNFKPFYDLCWVSCHYMVLRYILRHHATSAHHASSADGHTREDHNVTS